MIAITALFVFGLCASLEAAAGAPSIGFRIVASYPHDPAAFTQGLAFHDGLFVEGTGLNGASTLRLVEPETGRVRRRVDLAADLFGEGVAVVGDRVVQLTWKAKLGFFYDHMTLERTGTFRYRGEGWGIACDGRRLVMSDGTERLRLLDPVTLEEQGGVEVRDGSEPVGGLNELEFVDGRLLANVWPTARIAVIDPDDGRVRGWIDLSTLPGPPYRTEGVLNGIAWDPAGKRLFVTGKKWPRLFEIALDSIP